MGAIHCLVLNPGQFLTCFPWGVQWVPELWPAYLSEASSVTFIVWAWRCSGWAKCLVQTFHISRGSVCEHWGRGWKGALTSSDFSQETPPTHGPFLLSLTALASNISRFMGWKPIGELIYFAKPILRCKAPRVSVCFETRPLWPLSTGAQIVWRGRVRIFRTFSHTLNWVSGKLWLQ